jgi:CheY-like chemotaxis protein
VSEIFGRFVELLGGTIWANSVVDKGSTFTFKLPFVALSGDKDDGTSAAAAAAVVASSDHVIQHPLRFPSLEKNWLTPSKTTTAAKSGLLSHRRAYSLGVLLRGVKFSLPDASSYNAEFPNGEDSSDLGASKQWAPGGNGVTSSPVDQSVRTSVSGAIQEENGLFQQNVLLSDQDLLHSSKEYGISSDRGGSRPPVGMDSRQQDSSCQPSSAMAAESSKLVKNPKLEQCARNPSGHESLGTLLPSSSCSHNLSRAAEIPQKPTDVFILEKLRSLTTLSSTSQEMQANNSLSPSLQNQDGVSPQCLEISMHDHKDVVIDVPEVNYGRFLQGSDQCHPKGVASSGSLNLTVGLSSTDSASHKLAPNGANLGHGLSLPEGIVQTSQDALQTQQHQKVVLESQKRFPKKAAAMVTSPPKDAPEQQLKILLAEDNPINQKVATRQLEKYGHRVTIVSDGREALETVQVHHDMFDVVLMDVQMPNMDGLQATQHIREVERQEGWSRLPILGLTAHAIHGYQETCLSHGMDGYLGKPFNIKQLLIQMIDILPPDKKLLRDEG